MTTTPFATGLNLETPAEKAKDWGEGLFEASECERWRTVCGYELAATVRGAKEEGRDKEAITPSQQMSATMARSLMPDQRVVFWYEGGGGGLFSLKVFGEIRETAGMAEAPLQELVRTSLAIGRSEYQFRELTVQTLPWFNDGLRFGVEVEPGTVAVTRTTTSIGFDEHQRGTPVSMPAVSMSGDGMIKRNSGTLFKLVQTAQQRVGLMLTLERVCLSPADLAMLRDALKWVGPAGRKGDLPDALPEIVQHWLKLRQGIRQGCRLQSSQPLPESFASIVGKEVFPLAESITTRSVLGEEMTQTSRQGKGTALDLTRCYTELMRAPIFFPETTDLAAAGVKGFYNAKPPILAGQGATMGQVSEGDTTREVKLGWEERSRHLYVLGATGTGKSTLLYNLIMQDIAEGRGVCVIDPHGDLYQQVLGSVPENRVKDVVLFDPCDRRRAPSLNLLECKGPFREAQKNFVINEMCTLVSKLYNMEICGGPMFESYFRAGLGLIMHDPHHTGTLVDLPLVFQDRAYRKRLLEACGNPLLREFWQMAESAADEARLQNLTPYIVSKLNLFIHNALIRPIVGQEKSKIDFRSVMDSKQILLVNLARGALGELDLRLLGMVVLTKLICAAMTRMSLPPSEREPFMLYVDEFQNFTSDASASMLSESRKFGICLTLANQNLAQLKTQGTNDSVIHALLGNVGSTVFFRLGAPDAAQLAIYTKPEYGAEELQTLQNFHAAARLQGVEGPTDPFVFKTNPPRLSEVSFAKKIRANQRKFSSRIADVDKAIFARRGNL